MSLADCDGDPGHCSPLCSLIEKSCLMSDHLDQTIRPADTQPRLWTASLGWVVLLGQVVYWFEHWKVGRIGCKYWWQKKMME